MVCVIILQYIVDEYIDKHISTIEKDSHLKTYMFTTNKTGIWKFPHSAIN